MKKIILVILLVFSFLLPVNAAEMEISAKSAILIDQNTGKVLYKKNENEKLAMASMTKIMSLLLIMEKIDEGVIKYDDIVEISQEASSMGGSQIFLNPGDKYKVKDLLKGVAMASANDAVVALAEKTYGSKESFIEAMNKSGKPVWIRQVVVPGMMDSEEYIDSLVEYLKKIDNVERVEFLPFHHMGFSKYEELGINNPLKDVPPMDVDKCNELQELFMKKYRRLTK